MSIGMTTGLKALFSAQLSLQTAGHNISNAYVDGYSRQSVLLTTDHPVSLTGIGYLGTGVKASGIVRSVDNLLAARIQTQNRGLGRLTQETVILAQAEDIFNEPAEGGLASLFTKYFGTLNDMSLDPSDTTLRNDVVISAQVLTDGFNNLSGKLTNFREDLEMELDIKVMEANKLAKQITAINEKISMSVTANMEANELYDSRDKLIKDLNYLVDVQTTYASDGTATVLVDGRIYAGTGYHGELETSKDSDGNMYVRLEGDKSSLRIMDGEIKSLLEQQSVGMPGLLNKIDTLAREFAYEINRIHSTGIPLNGPFSSMKSIHPTHDTDGDGNMKNDPLGYANLPYPPQAGSLFVAVTNKTTGVMEQHEVKINPQMDSLDTLAAAIASVPHMGAYADAHGYLTLHAADGYAFDFSPRLISNPNQDQSFGNAQPTLYSSMPFPVTVAAGDSFDLVANGASHPITFAAGGTYTAEEMAAEITAQTGTASLVHVTEDGRLALQANPGSTVQFVDLAGSPPLSEVMGFGTAVEDSYGQNVQVELSGAYTGSANTNWRFEASSGSGTIGVTPDLTVSVYDETTGDLVTTLSVGEEYSPGDALEVADGVMVSFTTGSISADAHDNFSALVISDSDTARILPALGLNTFFAGSTAGDLEVNPNLVGHPERVSGSLTTEGMDNGNVMRMANLENIDLADLNGFSITDYYSTTVGKLGLDKEWADDMQDVQELLMNNLENQRSSVSGVSIDEEMLELEKFQQMLQAAVQFLQVMNEVTNTIMNIRA